MRIRLVFIVLLFCLGCFLNSCDQKETEKSEGINSSLLDMTDWIPSLPPVDLVVEGSILDVSHLLHKPAGKHGKLMAKDAKFYFEDGTEARFWGGNLSAEACFPDKKEAEFMAERLAQTGVNIIRLHHIDVMKRWGDKAVKRSVFGSLYPKTTKVLDATNLDRLDYLIYCLKQKGIYIFLSHASNRIIAPEDGFPGGKEAQDDVNVAFKYEGFFDPFLIQLQKEYTKTLLEHKNPYTGLALKDDPVMAMMEITNENHMYHYYKKRAWFTVNSKYYRDMLSNLFSQWLKSKYKTHDTLKAKWALGDKTKKVFDTSENLDTGNIIFPVLYAREEHQLFSPQKRQDIFEFLTYLQDNYYDEMTNFLKNDVGVTIPITPTSQFMQVLPVTRLTATADFVDAHSYWKHPSKIYNYIEGQEFITKPMLKDSSGGNIGRLSKYRVHDKPFTISEWNNCLPNPYRSEGVSLMAAYSSLNDWHPMHYALYHQRFSALDTINAFEAFVDPVFTATYPAASILFHRRDVKESTTQLYQQLNTEDVMSFDEDVDVDPSYGMIGKSGISFSDLSQPAKNEIDSYKVTTDPSFISSTKQLNWNTEKGILVINTEGSQAAIGFVGGQKVTTDDVVFNTETDFANISVTAISDDTISRAKNILITAVSDAQKKGVTLTPDGTKIATTGQFPFLMKPVKATISLQSRTPIDVFALSPKGNRTVKIDVNNSNNWHTFTISSEFNTVHYEVVKE